VLPLACCTATLRKVTGSLIKRHVLAVFYCVIVGLAFSDVILALLRHSQRNVTASHIVIIPFVTLALLVRARDQIFSVAKVRVERQSLIVGAVVAGVGGLLWTLSRTWLPATDDNLVGTTAVVVLLWVAGFVVTYGIPASRSALFPLAFLVFMIPIPQGLLDTLTTALKAGSAETVAGLLSLSGTTFHRDGYVFALPSVAIEIADECSGIRSSIALFLTTLLCGDAVLTSKRSKILLGLAVLPIAILKNGIRISGLTLLAVHVDPSFLTGRLHNEGGLVFFLMALAMLWFALVAVQRLERAQLGTSLSTETVTTR
jgi:exosortase